ncbi:MAG: hypothetical protein HQ559_07590 [Lentisphaerae bacterium]|nr:hypothetical protein [Lentisphaerota bacterium]
MNKRERYMAFVNFEPVDRIPRHAGYCPSKEQELSELLGGDPHEMFDDDGWYGCTLIPTGRDPKPDFSHYFPDRKDGENGFIISGGVGYQDHGSYHFTEMIAPLRNAESFSDIEQFAYGDNSNWSDEAMKSFGAEAQASGKAASAFCGSIFEGAWHIRGQAEFLADMILNPDWAEYIMDRTAANLRNCVVAAAKAGYDRVALSDDVATQTAMMMSPELWRAMIKPRLAGVIDAARSVKPDIHVWLHSDGNLSAILDDIVEVGVTILNPVQPECVDPLAIRKRYGKNLAFDGCVGTQTTFPFGSVADVRARVRELIEGLDGLNGGLTLSPTHALEPEVPAENIIAFFDECDSI